jgi:hypothetical protein
MLNCISLLEAQLEATKAELEDTNVMKTRAEDTLAAVLMDISFLVDRAHVHYH